MFRLNSYEARREGASARFTVIWLHPALQGASREFSLNIKSVEQTTKSWAATLRRTRHIGDFTRWTDPQAYQRAFARLLRDLKQAGT